MYIYCDCSDCGHERVRGPCYLEEYLYQQRPVQLNTIRRRRNATEVERKIIKVDNVMFSNSVMQVSVV
jgi:hypothetical protein